MNSVPSLWESSLYYGGYSVQYLVHYCLVLCLTQPVSTHNIKSVKWAINCWIYDNERLSYYALAFSLCAALLAALFAGLSWFTYLKERTVKSDKESKNNESAHSDPSDTSTNGSNTPLVVIRPRPDSLPVKKASSNDQLLQTLSELSSESPNSMVGQRELRARSTEIEVSP